MKLFRFLSFHSLCISSLYACRNCFNITDLSGLMSESLNRATAKCWTIEVPENIYLELYIKYLNSSFPDCSDAYLKVTVSNENEYSFRGSTFRGNNYRIVALSDVNITFTHRRFCSDVSSFVLEYHKKNRFCELNDHFRCDNVTCIPGDKVCDGRKDCDSGSDETICEKEVLDVKGVNASLENTGAWLLNNRQSARWGRNMHRAITALFLSQVASFRGQNLDEELMVKQLELQTSLALLRNSTYPLSVSELSMFINALSVACYDPRRFYGHDLVEILGERVSVAKSPSPGAYLTLCNSNWTLTQSDIRSLLHLLLKHSRYPFVLDNEISNVTNKLGGKIRVHYPLYVGDRRDVIRNIYLRLPEQSSAHDIMRTAQVADPNYKFLHRNVSGYIYIYKIAGIVNDPEAGKFWLLYFENSNGTLKHYTASPDKLFIDDDKEHLIMWYKTAHI